MIFVESYKLEYLKSVMSLVDTMKNHPDKQITRVAFDEAGNKFAVIFCDKETDVRFQQVKDITPPVADSIPEAREIPKVREDPHPINIREPRQTKDIIPWQDSEKTIVINATSKNHAIEVYRKTFPSSERTDASIIAYFYWKNPSGGAKR